MSDYVIIADSTTDISQAMADEMAIHVLPLGFIMEGKTYRNYLDGREMGFLDFYKKVRSGIQSTTNAINPTDYMEGIEPHLQAGKDVLIFAFTSALSSTYYASTVAAKELSEKYPGRKIYTVDSLSASMGEGLLVYLAAKMKQKGESIEAVRDWAEETKLKLCHWFTVSDLNHLKRGGRVSAATALVGTMLGIKPVLHVDNEGRLISVGKVRGRQASLAALVQKLEETGVNVSEQTIFISHGDCEADANWVADRIREKFSPKEIHINFVGPVVGTHSGPGTVALFFLGSKR